MVIRRRATPVPAQSGRSRSSSRSSLRMPHLVRLALLAGTAVCAVAGTVPPAATADVARLEPAANAKPGELPRNHDYEVVVTDRRGARRTFGPVPNSYPFAAPDGRHLLLVPDEADGKPVAPVLVPLDGSPVRPLRLPAGTTVVGNISRVNWTPDGTEVLVGDAIGWDPSVFSGLSAIEDPDLLRWTALRCPIATGVCTELAGPGGLVVGMPGGVVATSSYLSSLPSSWVFDEQLPVWERRTSQRGRTWIGLANDVRVTSTQLIGPTTTTVGRARRTGSRGIPVAHAAVGGPAGALISRITVVTELERRRGRVRLKARHRSPRFLLMTPGAPLRSFASRPLRLSRRDRSRVAPSTADRGQRLHFRPDFATADGWIGGATPSAIVPDYAVVATMDTEGRARPVTVRGRPATAWNLLRAAWGRSPGRIAGGIEVVGYEAAGNAIVSVGYDFSDKDLPGVPQRSATLRVPLDGKTRPTVIRGAVDVAW